MIQIMSDVGDEHGIRHVIIRNYQAQTSTDPIRELRRQLGLLPSQRCETASVESTADYVDIAITVYPDEP